MPNAIGGSGAADGVMLVILPIMFTAMVVGFSELATPVGAKYD